MKKVLCMFFAAILLLSTLSGCKKNSSTQEFSDEPFFVVDEVDDPLSDKEIKKLLSKVPQKRYEVYPGLHNVPLTATLYKDGEVVSIDVNDPRLIGLINLYNNSVYHRQFSYLQGMLDAENIEAIKNDEFRLELKYTPYDSGYSYTTHITRYDTVIITNGPYNFTLIDHSHFSYQDTFMATSHVPLHEQYRWLDLFGF